MSRQWVAANVAHVYADPDTASEQVTQAIHGQEVEILEESDSFARVRLPDRYEGWIARARLTAPWDQSDYFPTSVATLFVDVFSKADPHSDLMTKLVVTSRIALAHGPEVEGFIPVLLADKRLGYIHRVGLNVTHQDGPTDPDLVEQKTRRALSLQDLKAEVLAAVGRQAAQVARRFVGTPYLWGGCTPFGIDCSGFVQLCYRLSGVQLLRDAWQQWDDRRFLRDEGGSLASGKFLPGDLLVFSRRDDGRPTHIALALGDGRFIHSAGGRGVVIDPCTIPDYQPTYLGSLRISPHSDVSLDSA